MAPGDRDPRDELWYQALVAAAQGRHGDAIRALREGGRLDLEARLTSLERRYLIAEALLAAGDAEAAAAVPGSSPDPEGEAAGNVVYTAYPELALVRARAKMQLGRRADAALELDRLLAFWRDADEDLPLLVEARAMRARLAGPESK